MELSDDFLFNYFGIGDNPRLEDKELFCYAIVPYESRAEYERDKNLMKDFNSASKPQDRFLLAMAAKVERTDKEILGI